MNTLAVPISDEADALLQMQQQFLAGPLAQHDAAVLSAWQPKARSLWRCLQPIMALRAGMRQAVSMIDGHRVQYWVGGQAEGPTMLLLHGFGASRENWAFLLPRLAQTFRLLVPDLPGFGVSEFRYGAEYALSAQADRMAAFLAKQGGGPAYVVGSSMGGAIAAQLAARHAESVAALCLMNAAGAPGSRMSVLESGLAAGRNYLAPKQHSDTAKVMAICLHRRHRLMGMGLAWAMAGEMCHRHPVNQYLFESLVTSLHDTWCCLQGISAPTLVLWGDSDRVLDVSCSDAFRQQIPQSHAMVMPGVGHLPMLEEPAATANVLRDFWVGKMELSL